MISEFDDENDENDYDYDPDNFVFIDSIPSYEKYNVMEEFAAMQN